ncbi:hypothetical protein ACTFIN_04870 [Clostridium cagae]|uniref:Uncharacterized protein n=1 Tax=Clostridium botulinum (strain Eklund 17B / Type B) TaxID=935198 RepID=B2TLD7_CLOBB|nr:MULTISPECIES: hypothetical protein [Clostridium]ACD23378.1 hypothetical protein CLL_A0785 [Clostridium botulinum B str. Eklund 17B (NRP)]MBN1037760.1 hypothetical protein [Clostridium botulinum]MBN1044450.1 hypothetical protein [Clostridium botulinum]MBN1051117.1 hypothetical protein [Clostridium botulinum]MBN1054407.1 hypothetical protein [Clostridium botulinum]
MDDKSKLKEILSKLDSINNKVNNIQYQIFQTSEYSDNGSYIDFLYDTYTESLIENVCQVIGD